MVIDKIKHFIFILLCTYLVGVCYCQRMEGVGLVRGLGSLYRFHKFIMCFSHKNRHIFSYFPLVVLYFGQVFGTFACLIDPMIYKSLGIMDRSEVADVILMFDKIIVTFWLSAIIIINFCKRNIHRKLLEVIFEYESAIKNTFQTQIIFRNVHSNGQFYSLTIYYLVAVVYQVIFFFGTPYAVIRMIYFIAIYFIHVNSIYLANFILCLAREVDSLNRIIHQNVVHQPLKRLVSVKKKLKAFILITKFIKIINGANDNFGFNVLINLITTIIALSYYLYFFAWVATESLEIKVKLIITSTDFLFILPFIFVVFFLTRNGQICVKSIEKLENIVKETLMDPHPAVRLNGRRIAYRSQHQAIRIMAHLYQLDYRFIIYMINFITTNVIILVQFKQLEEARHRGH
uniref:Gustatory receptor n=1 Tax=Lutzomyia longipalpis TaxID=7200 RepID=A0A3F2ZD85_LUTLO